MDLSIKEKYAWVAGLFDGEGCLSIGRHKKKYPYLDTYYIQIQIVNTDKRALLKVIEYMKMGHIGFHKQAGEYVYQNCSRDKVFTFLDKIKPYTIIKRKQVLLVLKQWPKIRMKENSKSGLNSLRLKLFKQIKKMKREHTAKWVKKQERLVYIGPP